MKRPLLVALAVALVGAIAWAAPYNIDAVPRFMQAGFYVHPASVAIAAGNKVTRALGASSTINFSAASVGVSLSSGITVTGAQVGDPCFVGVPTAAAALSAAFGCYVDAADSVKVWFAPQSVQRGAATLNGASPSVTTATVTALSVCTCTPVGATAAIAAGGCAVGVSGTTLTMTSANGLTNDVNYDCVAPVDPASGTFYVRVLSSQ